MPGLLFFIKDAAQRRKQAARKVPAELARVDFLNEHNLGTLLHILYSNSDFSRGTAVPKSGLRFRPDFRCDELKLIVEFDGYGHYTNAEDAYWDTVKNGKYAELGFRVVRIPYFVQPCTETIRTLFDIAHEYPLRYRHGFVDGAVVLPCDFCGAGVDKFLSDLQRFQYIQKEIIESLRVWVKKLGHMDRVLPRCLHNIMDGRQIIVNDLL